ncbi:MAG: hypothetical protein IPK17_37280 [Chloroflexi bacterium]|uniref:hypothetical protein n=1 Tax=Candidatus Flexifilum breve TaxID=3140694 RepID=UPI0031355D80|nr:hypothetical protein [Chloroflexota bacterium]
MYSLDWLIPTKSRMPACMGGIPSKIWNGQTPISRFCWTRQAGCAFDYGYARRRKPADSDQARAGSLEVAKHPNLGWVVSVGSTNEIVKYVGIMLVKIFRLRFQRLNSMQEVIDFLHSLDPNLNWSAARLELLVNDAELRFPFP